MDCPLNLTWTTRLQCLYNFLHRNGLQLRKVVSVCCTIVNPRYWAQWGKSGTCPSFRSFWLIYYCWHYTYSLVDVCSELCAAAVAAGGAHGPYPRLTWLGRALHNKNGDGVRFCCHSIVKRRLLFMLSGRGGCVRVEPGDVSFSRTTLYYRYQWM